MPLIFVAPRHVKYGLLLLHSGADLGILKTGGAKISLALKPPPSPTMFGGEENDWGWFSAQKKGAPPIGSATVRHVRHPPRQAETCC